MAYSKLSYVGNGVTTQYAVNFTLGYLSKAHVVCWVDGEVDGLGAPVPRTLTWVTDGLVDIGTAPANGKAILIFRDTPKTSLIHDYSDGAGLVAANLDQSNLQNIMLAHEALDSLTEANASVDIVQSSIAAVQSSLDAGIVIVTDKTNIATAAAIAASAAAASAPSYYSGVAEPVPSYANMFWADTGEDIMKQRNEANTAWVFKWNLADGLLSTRKEVQEQSLITFTTAGTSTAFTLTPSTALTSNINGARFRVTFNQAAGANPHMAVSGLTALPLKYLNSYAEKVAATATQLPSGFSTDIVCDGTSWIIEKPASFGRKLVAFTRDMTAASGTESNTSVGFKSKKITFQWGIDGTIYHGAGEALPPGGCYSIVYAGGLTATDLIAGTGYAILQYTTDISTYQLGVVVVTATGFDITWIKGGTPTGTLRINAVCEE